MYGVIFDVADITIIYKAILPITVLVINVVVVIQVRRAAIHAAAILGVQPHHQSTSSVPIMMLITTSLIYVLLSATPTILGVILNFDIILDHASRDTVGLVWKWLDITGALSILIFAYNFYVYLITGKQFRSDLYKLFRRCLPSSCTCSCSCSSPSNPPPPCPPPVVAAAIVAADAEIARPVEADTAV